MVDQTDRVVVLSARCRPPRHLMRRPEPVAVVVGRGVVAEFQDEQGPAMLFCSCAPSDVTALAEAAM